MTGPNNEHDIVVAHIRDNNSPHYEVMTNLEKEEHYIGNMFPDLILLDKLSKKPRFIIEVKKNGNIAQCIQQWKTATQSLATLYIVVPEHDLSNAKSIAEVVGLKVRFGTYKIGENKEVVVSYES